VASSIVLLHVDDTAFGKCLRHARGEPFIVYKEVGLFLVFFTAYARARIPRSTLRPSQRPPTRGGKLGSLASQALFAHHNLSFGLIRRRRENDNRFIHVRAEGRVSPVRFLKPSHGNDRALLDSRPTLPYTKDSNSFRRVDIRVPLRCTNFPG